MEEPKSTIPLNNISDSHVANISQNFSSEKDLIDDEQNSKEGNIISRQIVLIRNSVHSYATNHSVLFSLLFKTIINLCLIAYTIAAIVHWYNNGKKSLDWCQGSGMLLILLTITAYLIIYNKLLKPFMLPYIKESCFSSNSSDLFGKILRISKRILIVILGIGLLAFLVIDSAGSRRRLVSAGGIFVFVLLGLIFSKHPNQVKWKTVFMGILVQALLGLLIIRWEVGRSIFMCIGERVDVFLRFGHDGAAFTYGEFLVNELHVFAFQSLSIIFFLSMVIEICFYFGWIQIICFKLGSLIQVILGTTIIESVNAVTSVFLGFSEAPLLYKPYIKDLTLSEIHAVMAGGFSTASGTVFAAYTALGVNPAYVITASVMSAPAALCFAKLLYPETDTTKTSIKTIVMYKSEERSVVDAACKGAISSINLVTGIIAIVIACVSLVAFFNSTIVWFASMIGIEGFTFEYVVGKLLTPIPYIMGVSPEQCDHVARLIGIKVTVNEFVAYSELGKLKKANLLTPRAEAMATFALCSFSNPAGLGSFIAILVSLAPSQKEKVTAVALRALISGVTTGLLTASIAGALMPEEGFGECLSCVTTLSPNVTTIRP